MTTEFGKILDGSAKRDAIHIAVAPVIAAETLAPGTHIGFTRNNDAEVVGKCDHPIGIVDPFLHRSVQSGERFWMFLYQNTITALRHEWTHPDFDSRMVLGRLQDDPAKKWIREFAVAAELSYDELIQAAHAYIDHGEYLCDGGKWEGFNLPDEFWDHFTEVTGRVNMNKRHSFFTCSC